MKKTKTALAIGLLGMLVSLPGLAENTKVEVKVANQTTETAIFGYEYFSGRAHLNPEKINPQRSTDFTFTSYYDSVSGIRFTVTAGEKKCRFSASHTAMPLLIGGYRPNWKKNGVSIGSKGATCTAALSGLQITPPFKYNVLFSIR